MQEELENEDQWASKEKVWKGGGFQREFFHLEIIPTITKHSRGVYLAKGGNILEYEAKAKALP
jgi:hypothetical protein